MANFEIVKNQLEGILASQLSAARSTQGNWEWFNALYRIVSQTRIGGTATISGPTVSDDTDYVNIEAAAATTLWGVLVDNPNAAEAVWLTIADLATANATPGTDLFKAALFVPSATMSTFLFPSGLTLATAMSVFAGTGTAAGLEGGTGVTGTNPTFVIVYTK